MANGLRWWVIPGALVVLVGTLQRIGGSHAPVGTPTPKAGPTAAPTIPADQLPAAVEVRDASGSRGRFDLQAMQPGAFVLDFGAGQADQRVALTIWRRDPAAADGRALWSELRPTVRADGTVPMLGVPAGDYDVEAELIDGSRVTLPGLASPGVHAVAAPAAPSR